MLLLSLLLLLCQLWVVRGVATEEVGSASTDKTRTFHDFGEDQRRNRGRQLSHISSSYNTTGPCVCDKDEDFMRMGKARHTASHVKGSPPWWQNINRKMGGFAFANFMGIRAPKVLGCVQIRPLHTASTDKAKIRASQMLLKLKQQNPEGFVIKPAEGFSASGVFIFGENSIIDVSAMHHNGKSSHVTVASVANKMVTAGGYWQAEEMVASMSPGKVEDYKFLMFGGSVAMVLYMQRSTSHDCIAVTDLTNTFRYESNVDCIGGPIHESTCSKDMHPKIRARNARAEWKSCTDSQMKSTVLAKANRKNPDPQAKRLWDETVAAVKKMGAVIDVQMRIDMFISPQGPTIGEFTPYHRSNLKDCFWGPPRTPGGPRDKCYLGKLWKEFGYDKKEGMAGEAAMRALRPAVPLPSFNNVSFHDVFFNPHGPFKPKCLAAGMHPDEWHFIQ
jgi:hypothetical protein